VPSPQATTTTTTTSGSASATTSRAGEQRVDSPTDCWHCHGVCCRSSRNRNRYRTNRPETHGAAHGAAHDDDAATSTSSDAASTSTSSASASASATANDAGANLRFVHPLQTNYNLPGRADLHGW